MAHLRVDNHFKTVSEYDLTMIHMFIASLNSTYSQNIAQHLCVWPSLAQTPHLVTLPSVSSLPPSGPFPLSCLSPALSSCLTTATASAGMSAAWRDTHIKMNSPIRHCFRCYRTTEFFVIRPSPSLPQTLSCVQRLFPFKCSTIAHFLLHTHGYGSKQSSLVPQSICIVLTLALTAKGGFLNLN